MYDNNDYEVKMIEIGIILLLGIYFFPRGTANLLTETSPGRAFCRLVCASVVSSVRYSLVPGFRPEQSGFGSVFRRSCSNCVLFIRLLNHFFANSC